MRTQRRPNVYTWVVTNELRGIPLYSEIMCCIAYLENGYVKESVAKLITDNLISA